MHEVSVMQSAMEIAVDHAKAQGAQQIHRVVMRVGTLAGVVPDSLLFAFDIVAQGTMAEGGALEIETVQALCHCTNCGSEFEPKDFFYECPNCGSLAVELKKGKELELAYLEVS
jgi:hydrogenase nickel incorporation protein HypA/HybF